MEPAAKHILRHIDSLSSCLYISSMFQLSVPTSSNEICPRVPLCCILRKSAVAVHICAGESTYVTNRKPSMSSASAELTIFIEHYLQ